MSFQPANLAHVAKFNSAASSELLSLYQDSIERRLRSECLQKSHQTFAASSMRCKRLSWFRLRGVDPDVVKTPDYALDFTAKIGTACHTMIQKELCHALSDDWIDVEEWLNSIHPSFEYTVTHAGFETQVEILDPAIRFACDGIIRLDGNYYLLEIKSSEFGSFNELTGPKSQHVYQAKSYCAFLNLSSILFLYIDRQYGSLKCYQEHVTDADKDNIWQMTRDVIDAVDSGIAPQALPKGDSWCTSSMCKYYKKCQEYGR